MTDIVDDWIAEVRAKAAGRTRYEGKPPYGDEAAAAEIERLRAEVALLREALEPFAEAAAAMDMNDRRHCPDDFEVIHEHGNELVRLDRGHFRAASAALKETGNDQT